MILKTAFEKLFKAREAASRKRPGADDGFDPHEKPFLDHLEDFRHTIFKILGTLAIFTALSFLFHKQLFELIQLPAKMPLAKISEGVMLWERLDLITLSPPEFIVLMLKLSLFSGIVISFPVTVYFLFEFLLPGLKQVEKKAIIPGSLVGFVLFLVGASFAFFVAVPVALKFFYVFENERISNIDPTKQAMEKPLADLGLVGPDGVKIAPLDKTDGNSPTDGDSDRAENTRDSAETDPAETGPGGLTRDELRTEFRAFLRESLATVEGSNLNLRYDEARDKVILFEVKGGRSSYRIGEYITFIARLVLVFGISFQLPVIVTILVRLELLTARVMRSTRTYAWIIILVASAIMTPPDVLTLAMLAGPMIILYEICIVIASFMERRREKRQLAEEEAYRARMAELHEKSADDLTEEEKEELHRAEIEQYEREHAHLYQEESDHEDGAHDHLVEHDPHAHHGFEEHGDDHDESWHEDHDSDWEDPDHHEETSFGPVQDWPNREDLVADGMESDHAEPIDTESAGAPSQPEKGGKEETPEPAHGEIDDPEDFRTDGGSGDEVCEPDGPVIDLNHASQEEIETLPGVGPALARTLIDHRPYADFDELEQVPGIGPEKLAKMMDRLMLG